MGDFITNPSATLPGPKSDLRAIPAGADRNQYLDAESYNALRTAALDLRAAFASRQLQSWEVADAAARVALTPTATDLGRVARQLDDSSLWVCAGYSPPSWRRIDGMLEEEDILRIPTSKGTIVLQPMLGNEWSPDRVIVGDYGVPDDRPVGTMKAMLFRLSDINMGGIGVTDSGSDELGVVDIHGVSGDRNFRFVADETFGTDPEMSLGFVVGPFADNGAGWGTPVDLGGSGGMRVVGVGPTFTVYSQGGDLILRSNRSAGASSFALKVGADGVLALLYGNTEVKNLVAGWIDVPCGINEAGGASALTTELYRDTQFTAKFLRHDQNDTLSLEWQMPHGWDMSEVNPHIHIEPMVNPASPQVVRFTGKYAWSQVGQAAPADAGWTAFTVDHAVQTTDAFIQRVVSLAMVAPPANPGPSNVLLMWVRRAGLDAADTYTTSKSGGTAAANVRVTSIDAHVHIDRPGSATEF